jgi:hypothetical protein
MISEEMTALQRSVIKYLALIQVLCCTNHTLTDTGSQMNKQVQLALVSKHQPTYLLDNVSCRNHNNQHITEYVSWFLTIKLFEENTSPLILLGNNDCKILPWIGEFKNVRVCKILHQNQKCVILLWNYEVMCEHYTKSTRFLVSIVYFLQKSKTKQNHTKHNCTWF